MQLPLIEEIRDAAVDGAVDLGTVLRKCKVLAAQLGSDQLESWLIWESNGYPDDVDVPEYRKWELQIRGNFIVGYNQWRDSPIPTAVLPEKYRKIFEEYQCKASISNIEEMLEDKESTEFGVQMNNLPILLSQSVAIKGDCTSAAAYFSRSNFLEVVNSVRNRILDFAIAIWKEYPDLGSSSNNKQKQVKPELVSQLFYTTIIGGSANIVGSSQDSNIVSNIECGNFDTLRDQLLIIGVSEDDIAELRSAIDIESTPTADEGFGPKVTDWITKMVGKAAQGVWKIGLGAAQAALTELLKKYFGA